MGVFDFLKGNADKAFEGGSGFISGITGMLGEDSALTNEQNAARNTAAKMEAAGLDTKGIYGDSFDYVRDTYDPYMQSGLEDLQKYRDLDMSYMPQDFEYSRTIGDFLDPSMGFQIEQSMRPIKSSAAAGGSLGSGATLKALQREGQRVANMNYGQAYDRMANDKRFAYKDYLDRANMRRQQNIDRSNQLQNTMNQGYNASQNVAKYQDNLGQRLGDITLQMGNIPSDSAIIDQYDAKRIRNATDPKTTGKLMSDAYKLGSSFF